MGYGSNEMVEQAEQEMEEYREAWIKKNAKLRVHSVQDLEQLWDDMQNDPYHADEDMQSYSDPTIDDRLAELEKARKQAADARKAKTDAKKGIAKGPADDFIDF